MASGWGGLNWILDEAEKRKAAMARLPNPFPESMDDPEARPATGTVQVLRSQEAPAPPLPVRRPMVDPVVAIKKETARGYNYTPEATEQLYQQPVHLFTFGSENPPSSEGQAAGEWQGLYIGRTEDEPSRISVWERPDWRPQANQPYTGRQPRPQFSVYDPESTLAHEFGHKWYFENMPAHTRQDWANTAWGMFADAEALSQRPNPNAYASAESYADFAAAQNMPASEMRFAINPPVPVDWNKYYAGLSRDVSSKWGPKSGPPVARG